MKVAASDYDGTLFRNGEIAAADIEAVRKWRARGHKFGPVSGRDYGMLIPQLRHYGIGFDFSICNNGGILHDGAGRVVYQAAIAPEFLVKIAEEPCVQSSLHFAFSARETTYLCHDREGSWIMREGQQWDFPITRIEEQDIGHLPQIHQFSLGFATPEESRAVADTLNEKFPAGVHAYPNRESLDITPPEVSKRQGIEMLQKVMGWEDAEIYVIGDETNDLPMLEAFGGYTVDTARAAIKERAKKVYAGVGAMLLDNL